MVWEIKAELAGVKAAGGEEGREVALSVRVGTIRDGSHGISLALGDRLVGEWTDSGAMSVNADQSGAMVRDREGEPRYRILAPGTLLSSEQVAPDRVRLNLKL